MSKVIISIVVPVYNVELYIRPCIDAILAQTFVHFELILIDDGAIDSSGFICDEYAQLDPRIRVIHKPNSGVADSRNIGIDASEGEWVVFIDSDDIVATDFLELLYTNAIDKGVDLVIAKLYRFSDKGTKRFASFQSREVYGKEYEELILNRLAIIDPQLTKDDVYWFGFYSCIYRPEIIHRSNIRFPKCRIGEDAIFLIEYMLNCDRAYLLSRNIYGYRTNPNSATNSFVKDYLSDAHATTAALRALFKKYDLDSSPIFSQRLCHQITNKLYRAGVMVTKNPSIKRGEVPFQSFKRQITECVDELKPYSENLTWRQKIRIAVVKLIAHNRVTYLIYRAIIKL